MVKVFLIVRVLHMLFAALWIGGTAVVVFFLTPAIEDTGADGGKVMAALQRHKFMTYMPSIGGLTILTGLWLIWRFSRGDFAASSMRMFGSGAVLGLASAIIGGGVVGRSAKRVAELAKQAAATADPDARAKLLAQTIPLKKRMVTFGYIVMAMLVAAFVLMAMGHYV